VALKHKEKKSSQVSSKIKDIGKSNDLNVCIAYMML
jgi:hypothetical protein